MFTKLPESSGNVLGIKVSGVIKRKDYEVIDSEADAILEEYDSMSLLLYFDQFIWEVITAWGKDAAFGAKYGDKVYKMAIVGDKKWQEKIAKWSTPFYGEKAKFFPTEDIEEAWNWVKED